jgi:hypothetical protein
MELIKIDIINGQIIKRFSDDSVSSLLLSELTNSQKVVVDNCIAMMKTMENEWLFISINIINPITRLVFFLTLDTFTEFLYEDLTDEQKILFNDFINL